MHFRLLTYAFASLFAVPISLQSSDDNACSFPDSWRGKWYQKGVPSTITIDNNTMTFKGSCRQTNKLSLFLLEDRKMHCVRCLVMIQKHYNILQYRQTYCLQKDTLTNVCTSMTSDQTLFTMFRIDARPIKCPFEGRYTFTYNRAGRSACKNPPSSLYPCSQTSQFLFRFQACIDLSWSQSSVEKLTCLASWKEGAIQYLMGTMNHALGFSQGDQYRCFVYKKIPEVGYLLSQSADASCNGFVQPGDGSRIMTITKVESNLIPCEFPQWLMNSDRWSTLNSQFEYVFNESTSKFSILEQKNGEKTVVVRATCTRLINVTSSTYQALVHYISGCSSHHVCLHLDKKNLHVADIITQESTVRPEYERCNTFKNNKIPTTIVAEKIPTNKKDESFVENKIASTNKLSTSMMSSEKSSLTLKKCQEPFGRSLELSIQQTIGDDPISSTSCTHYSTIRVACDSDRSLIQILSECPSITSPNKELNCIDVWNDTSSTFILAKNMVTNHKLCIRYVVSRNLISLRFQGSCSDNSKDSLKDELIFNITSTGTCKNPANPNSSLKLHLNPSIFIIICIYFIVFLMTYI